MRQDPVRSSGMLRAAGPMALLVLVTAVLLPRPCEIPGVWIGPERACCAPDCCPAERTTRACCLERGHGVGAWVIHSHADGAPPHIQGASVLLARASLVVSSLGETRGGFFQSQCPLYLRSCSLLL